MRADELDLTPGRWPRGRWAAITDVPGVLVGHVTVREADRNTGVTAVLPHDRNLFREPVAAAVVAGNGYGKTLGSIQVRELGTIETPILLTSTLSVWRAADALVEWMLEQPGMEEVLSINPVVAETNDGRLTDIRARPIGAPEVRATLAAAATGPVAEGSVGAGTGTVCFGWKGGIGTSSRVVSLGDRKATVGVLTQTNYGGDLRIDGMPIGRLLCGSPAGVRSDGGSVIFVLACDAPLTAPMLERVARRCFAGLARTGSVMEHESGDVAIAFATTPADGWTPDEAAWDALFYAAAEATEEAIYNSLLTAEAATYRGRCVDALPAERVRALLAAREPR